MNKQVARVDEYINEAVRHIASINNILQMVQTGDILPNESQHADILTLANAAKSCNELVKSRFIRKTYTVKQAKLTPVEIIAYVNEAKSMKAKL